MVTSFFHQQALREGTYPTLPGGTYPYPPDVLFEGQFVNMHLGLGVGAAMYTVLPLKLCLCAAALPVPYSLARRLLSMPASAAVVACLGWLLSDASIAVCCVCYVLSTWVTPGIDLKVRVY